MSILLTHESEDHENSTKAILKESFDNFYSRLNTFAHPGLGLAGSPLLVAFNLGQAEISDLIAQALDNDVSLLNDYGIFAYRFDNQAVANLLHPTLTKSFVMDYGVPDVIRFFFKPGYKLFDGRNKTHKELLKNWKKKNKHIPEEAFLIKYKFGAKFIAGHFSRFFILREAVKEEVYLNYQDAGPLGPLQFV